jgi:imidazolonepropionase
MRREPDVTELLLENVGLLATCAGWGDARARLGLISDAHVLCRDGLIVYAGSREKAPTASASAKRIDARGQLVTPGFIDAHTHLVFAGERANEFALRCRGASYLEIAQAGGGIVSTVKATRAASEDDLVSKARPRLARLLEQGATTVEAKSGYGLNVADELKLLRAIKRLDADGPLSLVPTLLAAHTLPPEYRDRREDYVRLCIEEILPAVAEAKLARFCDAFVEESAFTLDEGRRILSAGRALGMIPRLHADQLTSGGGAELAAEVGAATADHLEHISKSGIEALARANVASVLVPTSTWFLRQSPFPPGRALADAGVTLALGTNVNPGSAMSENLALAMSLLCLSCGLSPEEVLLAATVGGAKALKLDDRGRLVPGLRADLVVHGCSSVEHLPYHAAVSHARVVIIEGRIAFERELVDCS